MMNEHQQLRSETEELRQQIAALKTERDQLAKQLKWFTSDPLELDRLMENVPPAISDFFHNRNTSTTAPMWQRQVHASTSQILTQLARDDSEDDEDLHNYD